MNGHGIVIRSTNPALGTIQSGDEEFAFVVKDYLDYRPGDEVIFKVNAKGLAEILGTSGLGPVNRRLNEVLFQINTVEKSLAEIKTILSAIERGAA